MAKVKHVYVDGKLIGIGDIKIEEIEKEPEYFLKITNDDYANYPFEDDEAIKFYSNHRRYIWDGAKLEELLNKFEETPKKAEELVELLNKAGEHSYVAIYGYDHSGLSVSLTPFSCPWDSGLLGILRIDKSCANPQKVAENWVKTVNMWLQGDVYWVKVFNELGECVDSIGDIYAEDAEELAKRASEYISDDYHFTDEDYKKAYENRNYI